MPLFAVIPAAVCAQEADYPRLTGIIAVAQAVCDAATDGLGELVYGDAVIVPIDLDGDGGNTPDALPDDVVIDLNHIHCSLAVSLWTGTGGAPVHFVIDGTTSASWPGLFREAERMGPDLPAVILLARHGTACDGFGARPCVQAIVATDGLFSTVILPAPIEAE